MANLSKTDADLVAFSRERIERGSKSFAVAARLFAPQTRASAYMLYAWCRHCDDVIDGQSMGFVQTPGGGPTGQQALEVVEELKTKTKQACAGHADEPVFEALRHVCAKHDIPDRYPLDLIAGFQMDAEAKTYRTLDDTLLYCYHVAGVVGVMMAMPRRKTGVAAIGGVIAAIAGGGLLLAMLLVAGPAGEAPNPYFYAFSFLALASGVRMITHPRPVYAALYFILTIIASCGMYLLLSAEFMAFALIIIYAGAILITYLFVIMLATQAPTEDEEDRLADYDAVAREPIASSAIGFSLLAVLTTMLFTGAPTLDRDASPELPDQTLAALPVKIDRLLISKLRESEDENGNPLVEEGEVLAQSDGLVIIDPEARTVTVTPAASSEEEGVTIESTRVVEVPEALWPEELRATNVEGLGMNLLGKHPMTIEIAGVILLMAMLGATVLARKQVDIEEELKRRMARRLSLEDAERGAA